MAKLKDSDYWLTPDWVIEKLGLFAEPECILDPCADTSNNVGAGCYYTEKDDGLTQDWVAPFVFVNPPFSRTGRWVNKFMVEAGKQNFYEGIMLTLSGAVNNIKVYDAISGADAFLFPTGRISFKPCLEEHNTDHGFDRDVVLTYVGERVEMFSEAFKKHGRILVPYTLE